MLTLTAAALAAVPVRAQPPITNTLTLQPASDTSIFEEGSLSNGGGDFLFTGVTALGAERRALLQFDLSAIPTDATIESATLEVTVSRTISGTVSVRLHRLLAPWVEGTVDAPGPEGTGAPAAPGDATWTARSSGLADWSAPGGDFVTTDSARAGLRDNARYQYSGPGLLADLQEWVSGGSDNNGWIMVANPAAGFGSAKRLNSRENPDPATRPVLTVTYNAPVTLPPPLAIPVGGSLWLILLLGGTALLSRRFVTD